MHTLLHRWSVFAHAHDDLPAFHAGYLLLTFLAAILFNLGAFAVLVVGHMALDFVKYRDVHHYSWPQTIRATALESLVDLTLLALGTFFAVYLHHGAGIVAITGLLELEGALVRLIGTVIPRMHIFSHMMGILSHVRHHLREATVARRQSLSFGQKFCTLIALCSVVLVATSPILLPFTTDEILHVLAHEWVPWRV